MKAIAVPIGAVVGLGLRLDTQPYMDAAYETTGTLRAQTKASARRAYWRAARRGLQRVHNMHKFNKQFGLDKVRRIT